MSTSRLPETPRKRLQVPTLGLTQRRAERQVLHHPSRAPLAQSSPPKGQLVFSSTSKMRKAMSGGDGKGPRSPGRGSCLDTAHQVSLLSRLIEPDCHTAVHGASRPVQRSHS